MDVPVSEYTTLDLERELYAYGLDTGGSKQERYERLLEVRQRPWTPRKPAIAKFGARVQLEDFAEIRKFQQSEYDLLTNKVQWRLERVRRAEDGEGLEYFHPEVLTRIDPSKAYMLNMDEFLVRQEPYVHKIFVIFVTNTNGQEQQLWYARSLAKLRSWDEQTELFEYPLVTSDNLEEVFTGKLQTTIISPESIAKALSYVLTKIRDKGFNNFVALVCDQMRFDLPAVMQLLEASSLKLPSCVADLRDLQKEFRVMFCTASVRCSQRLSHELYVKSTYVEQLNGICSSNSTKNMSAMLPLIDYVNRLSDILNAMWQLEEHLDKPISLLAVHNQGVKIYAAHVRRELPPITFEDCAAGAGLLQLLVFDALWWLSQAREPEEM